MDMLEGYVWGHAVSSDAKARASMNVLLGYVIISLKVNFKSLKWQSLMLSR